YEPASNRVLVGGVDSSEVNMNNPFLSGGTIVQDATGVDKVGDDKRTMDEHEGSSMLNVVPDIKAAPATAFAVATVEVVPGNTPVAATPCVSSGEDTSAAVARKNNVADPFSGSTTSSASGFTTGTGFFNTGFGNTGFGNPSSKAVCTRTSSSTTTSRLLHNNGRDKHKNPPTQDEPELYSKVSLRMYLNGEDLSRFIGKRGRNIHRIRQGARIDVHTGDREPRGRCKRDDFDSSNNRNQHNKVVSFCGKIGGVISGLKSIIETQTMALSIHADDHEGGGGGSSKSCRARGGQEKPFFPAGEASRHTHPEQGVGRGVPRFFQAGVSSSGETPRTTSNYYDASASPAAASSRTPAGTNRSSRLNFSSDKYGGGTRNGDRSVGGGGTTTSEDLHYQSRRDSRKSTPAAGSTSNYIAFKNARWDSQYHVGRQRDQPNYIEEHHHHQQYQNKVGSPLLGRG
ncbi:unnamed protein product, partial [Amoebophrya sp. A25]